MKNKYSALKAACYTVNISMSVVVNLPPLLFITFRDMYGISYGLIGLLILINYTTQLLIDLIFSFFSHKFNIAKTVKFTPLLTVIGLIIFALTPFIIPKHIYLGFIIGTVIYSVSGGLVEVLISPVIAAIPSDDPDREMSKLHSTYAWGVVGVILLSSAYIFLFGAENWQYLMLFFAAIPMLSALLFMKSSVPEMDTTERASGAVAQLKNKTLWLCVLAIFTGGAAECTMAQWASGYIEQALMIPKVWGDIFGVAMFALMLGIGRTLYSKIGRNIEKLLLLGSAGSAICYILAALTDISAVGLFACAFTGLCTSMLWPGSLIVASDKMPGGGVFMYAMMAAGGDLGASVGPQLIGAVADLGVKSNKLMSLAENMSITSEQLGLKIGMLIGALFPICAAVIYLYIYLRKKTKTSA